MYQVVYIDDEKTTAEQIQDWLNSVYSQYNLELVSVSGHMYIFKKAIKVTLSGFAVAGVDTSILKDLAKGLSRNGI